MATLFPGSLDTAASLYDTVNNAESTLSGSHTAGGTTIDLTSAALFPSTGGVIYVGNERTTYTGKSSNQLTGMAVLSNNYSAGTVVAMYVDAEHHNALRGAVVAVEARVGVTGDTTAGTLTKRIADLEAGSASVEAQIHAAAAKAVPADADEFGLADSAGAWALKKTTWAQVKATLKTYFDTLYQTLDATLTALAGVTTGADKLPYFDGTDTATTTTLTAAARTVLDDATVGDMVNTLGGATATGTGGLARAASPSFTTPKIVGGSFAYTLTGGSLAADRVLNLPVVTATDTLATLGLAQTWTAAQTFRAAAAVRSEAAATQDAMVLAGRAGGTGSYAVTLTPTTLTANRTATFPDADMSVGYINVPQNSQSTAYTAVLADAGKHLLHPSADTTARTFTIPANSSVAYLIGTALTFVNQASAGVMTIAITTDTMRLAGAGTTGSRTLAANGIATALKLTSTEWIISGTGLT